jgi:hypothetical protein
MTGGGGAGGVGHIQDMYYYAGGGGGSAASIINKPIPVLAGDILNVTVGKGSDLRYNLVGGESIVEVLRGNAINEILIVGGGSNGSPNISLSLNVSGGRGGVTSVYGINGFNGEDGMISMPSFRIAKPGTGAPSLFYPGGVGGNAINPLGGNGLWGSGGGGSVPQSVVNFNAQVSGNGGDGVVILQW